MNIRMQQRLGVILKVTALTLIMAFVAIPILVVAWTSVQPELLPTLPPKGLSLRWWSDALTAKWLEPIWFSVQIALVASAAATVLGTGAAFYLSKSSGRWHKAVDMLTASPLLLPEIVISLAILQFVAQLHARSLLGMPLLIASHIVIGIPFVVRTVWVSLVGVQPDWERAAADLGASRIRTFVSVTLPLIRSGLFAGALLSFVISFNNVELSLFVISSTVPTAPIAILNYMTYDYSPVLACVAMLTIATVLLAAGIVARFTRITQFLYERAE